MSTAATHSTQPARTLHLALDLGNRLWKLAFATGIAHAPRLRTMPARDLAQLDAEVAAAKARFGLAPNAPVVSCYEAGRDGFWLHRALVARGVASHVVDSASITENRRARRAKSDRLDAAALVRLLLRHHAGERGVWSVVHVPSVEAEDRRQLHRELFTLTRERTRQVNRIKGLLALHGIVLAKPRGLPARPPELRDWSGAPLRRRSRRASRASGRGCGRSSATCWRCGRRGGPCSRRQTPRATRCSGRCGSCSRSAGSGR
jgi:hypothetical protein